MRTLFGVGSQHPRRRRRQPNGRQLPPRRRRQPKRRFWKHSSSGEEFRESIYWNYRDPRKPLPAGTPTTVLEQLQKRIKIITDDMTSVARSCCMEMATGSALPISPERRVLDLHPPKRSTPRRRRKPTHRRKRGVEKRACGDTIEESISSTPPQRKRVRTYKGLPSNFFSHVTFTDSCFHIVVSHYSSQRHLSTIRQLLS